MKRLYTVLLAAALCAASNVDIARAMEEKQPETFQSFDQLPDELKVYVFFFLSPTDLINASQASNSSYALSNCVFSPAYLQAYAQRIWNNPEGQANVDANKLHYTDTIKSSKPRLQKIKRLLWLIAQSVRPTLDDRDFILRNSTHSILMCNIFFPVARNINTIVDDRGNNILHTLCDSPVDASELYQEKFTAVLKFVLKLNPDLKQENKFGYTPTMYALEKKHPVVFNALYSLDDQFEQLKEIPNALHYALQLGGYDFMRKLIKPHNLSSKVAKIMNLKQLDHCFNDFINKASVKPIFCQKCDAQLTPVQHNINHHYCDNCSDEFIGKTPLELLFEMFPNASDQSRDKQITKTLKFFSGLDDSITAKISSQQALGFAIRAIYADLPRLSALIIEKFNLDVNCLSEYGDTLLHAAVGTGDISTVQIAIKKGASANQVNDEKNTPLHSLSEEAESIESIKIVLDIAKLLLSKGADLTLKNEDGLTPLMLAVKEDAPYELIKLFLTEGSNVNELKDLPNVLHYVTRIGNYKLLVDLFNCDKYFLDRMNEPHISPIANDQLVEYSESDISKKIENGNPLSTAVLAAYGKPEDIKSVIKVLLDNNIKINPNIIHYALEHDIDSALRNSSCQQQSIEELEQPKYKMLEVVLKFPELKRYIQQPFIMRKDVSEDKCFESLTPAAYSIIRLVHCSENEPNCNFIKDVVLTLFKNGAHNAVHYAAAFGTPELVELLLQDGQIKQAINQPFKAHESNEFEKIYNGMTPTEYASVIATQEGLIETLKQKILLICKKRNQ